MTTCLRGTQRSSRSDSGRMPGDTSRKRCPHAVTCAQLVALIGQLYGIERAATDRHLDAAARQRLRQEQASPILARLQAYLQEQNATAVAEESAGYSYRLRAAQLGHADALHRGRATQVSRTTARSRH
jgi:hypothetical protein